MHPTHHAVTQPDKPAVIMSSSGEVLTYRTLEERANRLAHLLRERGLKPGDGIAVVMENSPRFFEVYWAAIRSGYYLTPVNHHLSPDEAAFIIDDCGARAVIAGAGVATLAGQAAALLDGSPLLLMVGGSAGRFADLDEAVANQPTTPIGDPVRGETMLYSSGTTGRPKGIRKALSGQSVETPIPTAHLVSMLWQVDGESVYLSPAPLYHAAPLGFTAAVQSLGGTVIVMERFDPAEAIGCIDRFGVTHSQWVPTMFSRMLKLDPAARASLDGSTHRRAIHAAAPCPVGVKRQMIEWWGPILCEYYAGTEMNGFVHCTSEEWLARPGTVGKPILGTIHICDEEGRELTTGEPGIVYFERDIVTFEYHGDPEKTRKAQHPEHPLWTALGDVGYVDTDGYLFLTDRASFMIISGGVNIYPQEIENELILHPAVADVAVLGVPHDDMGEQVKAVVQPAEGIEGTPELAAELQRWLGERIAAYKVPRSVEFRAELPRLPTGKLYKRVLRDEYWQGRESRLV